MKNLFLIIVIIFLSACSPRLNEQLVVTDPPAATTAIPVDPTQDLIVSGVKASFSTGAHADKLTCEQCHSTKGGAVMGELTWTDESSGQVETIPKPMQLCVKCHEEQVEHTTQGGANLLAHSDFECTGCHNPHTLQASCTQSLCHFDIQTTLNAQTKQPENHTTTGDQNSFMCGGSACHDLAKQVALAPIYHQPVHRNVPCYVCHDVSGLPITLTEDQSWITTGNFEQTTSSASEQVVSHSIGSDVICARCHSYDNAWNLIEVPPSN